MRNNQIRESVQCTPVTEPFPRLPSEHVSHAFLVDRQANDLTMDRKPTK
jgi:hypothetical protein